MLPDFVIVGNVARDVSPEGWRPGGTALYAAEVARGLDRRVGIVTAATEDVAAALPAGLVVVRHPATASTSFENIYHDGRRVQYLRAAGEAIPAGLVPDGWTGARVALLGPVYHEVDAALAARFHAIVGVCGQGFLRGIDQDRRVQPLPPAAWDAQPLLRHASVLFLSEEDIALDAAAATAAWAKMVQCMVVTDGRHGAEVYAFGERRHVPAFAVQERDPTGAGDAFAAGFLVALDEGADPWTAARFGAVTASFVVETIGAAAPSRVMVEHRLSLPTA